MAIAFIGTGGTFANEGTGPLDYLSYLHAGRVLPAPEVLRLMPDLPGGLQIVPVPFAAVRSKEMGPARWPELARTVAARCADPEIDGVIVAHGTGTLEETAFFLHLTVSTDKPIVLTGAQRPPTTIGSDAQKNFLDAARWIASRRFDASGDGVSGDGEGGRGENPGVVVVMDQQVHSARGVAKLANHTLGAVESPATGPIGRINVDGTVSLHGAPRRRHTAESEFAASMPDSLPRVDIVHQYAGADAAALHAHVAAGARGLVVVGFPPGTNTPEIDDAIAAIARDGLPIVQASRAIRDPQILPRPDLAHLVCNTDLSPQHARILLMLALSHGHGLPELRRVFAEY